MNTFWMLSYQYWLDYKEKVLTIDSVTCGCVDLPILHHYLSD